MNSAERYRKACVRHFESATALLEMRTIPDQKHCGVAGYLFGIAAELALKSLMSESRLFPASQEFSDGDPFYAHFPEIKRLLRASIQGRRAGELRKFAEDNSFMSDWTVKMRYSPQGETSIDVVQRWRISAQSIMSKLGQVK